MGRLGAALGRNMSETGRWVVGGLILIGVIVWLASLFLRDRRGVKGDGFAVVSVADDPGVLHILTPGGPVPKNIAARLRDTATLDALLAFIYDEFGYQVADEPDAPYKPLTIHLPGREPIVFTRAAGSSRGDARASLSALLG